jgi:tetratricopeptide (TPR) repeat protein
MSRSRRAAPATRPVSRSRAPAIHGSIPWLPAAALVLAVFVVYGRVTGFDFINHYDDMLYVTENPHVRGGLTAANIAWAFTHPCAGNWHPLTMLSHMADCQLFGVTPGRHHLVNLLFHAANTLLLFWVLFTSTRRPWPSLFVAGVFALHPMHVESVAWIAERKDVLSTFFWLLTLWAYFRYVRAINWQNYLVCAFFLICGLMAKPMLVTLPFVLVLMDFWPLERISAGTERAAGNVHRAFTLGNSIVEKLPLIALVLPVIAVTMVTQQRVGAVSDVVSFPIGLRIANALVAYATYVLKLFAPTGLAVLYPYPTAVPLTAAIVASLVLLGITAALFAVRRQAPYALTGWLWFAGTLVPVIGIVQVGSQAMADRYTYVPHIGLCIALTWGCADLLKRWRVPARVSVGLAAGVLCVLSWQTWMQVGFWKDAEHLFRHAMAVTQNNYIAHNNYGAEMLDQKNLDEAVWHLERAVEINPVYEAAVYNLGLAYQMKRRYDESARTLEWAVRLDPGDERAEYRLAVTLALQQKYPDAMPHYEAAVRLAPEIPEIRESYSNALINYGSALGSRGEYREAMKVFEQALRMKPDNENARQNLIYVQQLMAAAGTAPPP